MFKKLFILLFSAVLNKGFLLILPYVVSGEIYNEFNSLYYSATMLTVLSLFGFDFLLVRNNLSIKPVLTALIINSTVSFIIFSTLTGVFISGVLMLMVSNVSFSLYTTSFLFRNDLRNYLISSAFYFILGVSSVLISEFFNISLFTVFSSASMLLITGLFFTENGRNDAKAQFRHLYILGGSIFLINALSGMVFSFDKYIVNNYFEHVTGNAYTFAWTVLVPVFYIGNLFEKQIYTSTYTEIKYREIGKIALLNAATLLFYLITVNTAMIRLKLLPDSVDVRTFGSISLMLSTGLFLFSCFHFPINGIILKYASSRTQKMSGLINLALLVIFVGSILIALVSFSGGIGTIITISFTALILSALFKMIIVMDELRKTPLPNYQDR